MQNQQRTLHSEICKKVITANDFTSAGEGVMPHEPGVYLCLLQDEYSGRYHFAFATYSPKAEPNLFFISSKAMGEQKLIGYEQIESPQTIAATLIQEHEKNG